MDEATKKELTLHYIDKTMDALKETGQIINRCFISMLFLSFVIIALSSGIISTDKSLSISGFNLIIPLGILLIAGTWTIDSLLIYCLSLIKRIDFLEKTIVGLYRSLGYSEESMSNDTGSPLRTPNVLTYLVNFLVPPQPSFIRFEGLVSIFLLIVYLFIVLFIPIAASFFATYKIVIIFGLVGWIWLVLVSEIVLFVIVIVSFIRSELVVF